jgi:hypothetical protein
MKRSTAYKKGLDMRSTRAPGDFSRRRRCPFDGGNEENGNGDVRPTHQLSSSLLVDVDDTDDDEAGCIIPLSIS